MDLKKAFDNVSHKIMLKRLCHYGIRGPVYDLIGSYLFNRNQFVSINKHCSSSKPINIGVPQGSILGLLLFLVYVNDISDTTSCIPRLFADDTCLLLSNYSKPDLENKCSFEMLQLHSWYSANKLEINPTKSAAIIIPAKLHDFELDINFLYNNQNIVCYNISKYLGVIIDNNLNFKTYIHNVENKVSRSVEILSTLVILLPSSILLQLYHALVHPHLLYGLLLWGYTFPSYLSKLQSLQNKAVRIKSDFKFKAPLTSYFKILAVLKIVDLYNLELGKSNTLDKINLPPCFNTFFKPISAIHNRLLDLLLKIVYMFPNI